jgi:hypothetical protein
VIEEVGRGQLQFKHLTFQEYLAGVASRRDAEPRLVADRRARLRTSSGGRPSSSSPAACSTGSAAHGRRRSPRGEIHALWPEHAPLVRAARITAITGRFLPAFRCTKLQLPRELAQRDAELRAEAEAMFTVDGAAKVEEKLRIAAAEAIGLAGDRRIAPERFETNLLTQCPGTSTRLGKFLVTVEEFVRFIEDAGYRRENSG